ncbi:hypothetical protein [Nodosilinea sp. E11]|uniref:hypothetical protein n=1 Tax=Nodosilinea sp. E11 TaxID=3037479 RepID=UPI00293493AF|nr:hypothetical protein [Nodosilinea sp. E11]WOD41971.1 hypothetical protein RRF56_14340 [Nodosilinea sp. E11]
MSDCYPNAQQRDYEGRRAEAARLRDQQRDNASNGFDVTPPPVNGDEDRFKHIGFPGFASFTKGLAHNANGLVDPSSLQSLLDALQAGTQAALEQVQLGGGVRKLVNPLNAFAYQTTGNDSNGARIAAAPAFASRSTAIDMVERYWMALCRDVPFDRYATSGLVRAACDDLNALGFADQFGFVCTPETLFRGPYAGCDVGPHVSQFLLQDFQFGNQPIQQQQRYPRPGLDYMTDLDTWNQVNNGDVDPSGLDIIDGSRYITTLRDGGQWVHIDFPHQAGLWATIMLLNAKAKRAKAIPYGMNRAITTAEPFGSLGGPDITIQSGLAGVYALKHAWFQKWCVHRRLRPEVYAQRLELFRRGILGGAAGNPCNDEKFNDLFGEGAEVWRQTKVLNRIYEHNRQQNMAQDRGDREGSWLLPMGFPEGSPTHPAYPGGHSAFVAAAATVAKAYFADGPFPNPKVPVDGGSKLGDYCGEPLTIHGELNKLIANVTLFRDGAGMHWRTDGTTSGPNAGARRPGCGIETGGNLLGERLAISMLRDARSTYREEIGEFAFEGINGNSIRF